MPLFKKVQNNLIRIKEKDISLEKDIQHLIERNLKSIFNLEYVSSEFSVESLRIDTLAFDTENKSFVIIEYKKDRNFSVIDQGFAYLALLLNNKADFLLEYNGKKDEGYFKKKNIEWSQSKVIFVSPFYTIHQKSAINFKNLPLELWEVHYYEDNIVEFEKIEPLETAEKIDTITKDEFKKVNKDIKIYDLEWHLKKASEKTKQMFFDLRDKILELGDVREKINKFYIGYHPADKYFQFCQVYFFKSKLTLFILLPDKKLVDHKHWVKKSPSSWGWAKNSKYFEISNENDIPYALELIKQSYEFNKNR